MLVVYHLVRINDDVFMNVWIFCLVINMTLPDEKESYIHRIGRVGRAER
jgi:hypothetical protein